MGTLVFLLAACMPLQTSDDAPQKIVSPDGKIQIAGKDSNMCFVDIATGKKLAPVFPADQRGEISNVSLDQAKWSPDGRKLAVLAYYGTKLSEILIYRIEGKSVSPVSFNDPPIDDMASAQLKKGESMDADDNSVGKWLNNDTCQLVFGVDILDDAGNSRHFLVPARLTFHGSQVTLQLDKPRILSDS